MERRYETMQFEGKIVGAEDELLVQEAGGTRTVFRITIEIEGPTPNLCRLMHKRAHIVLEEPAIIERTGQPGPEPVDYSIYGDCGDVMRKTMDEQLAYVKLMAVPKDGELTQEECHQLRGQLQNVRRGCDVMIFDRPIDVFQLIDGKWQTLIGLAQPHYLDDDNILSPCHEKKGDCEKTYWQHSRRTENGWENVPLPANCSPLSYFGQGYMGESPARKGFVAVERTGILDPRESLDEPENVEPRQETWRDRPSQL